MTPCIDEGIDLLQHDDVVERKRKMQACVMESNQAKCIVVCMKYRCHGDGWFLQERLYTKKKTIGISSTLPHRRLKITNAIQY